MKGIVNRSLQAGIYNVYFNFSDFTPEELEKMQAFGVPSILIQWGRPGARSSVRLPLNQIGPSFVAGFQAEEEAKEYELSVLSQVRVAMETLRQQKDNFSSSEEVAI